MAEEKPLGYNVSSFPEIRRVFHRWSEPGFHERLTLAMVAEFLRTNGCHETHEGIGVASVLRAGSVNFAIGLRRDTSGQPISKKCTHGCKSESPGVIYECRLGGHMSELLGAARVLVADPCFDRTVAFVFCGMRRRALVHAP